MASIVELDETFWYSKNAINLLIFRLRSLEHMTLSKLHSLIIGWLIN